MHPWIRSAARSAERLAAPPGTVAEERRKRTYLVLALVVLIPTITIFGIEDLRQGDLTGGSIVLAMAAFMAVTLMALPRVRDLAWVFRLGVTLTLALELFELAHGGGEGFALLWFYCVPVLLMTLFGSREGSLWTLAALVIAGVMLLTPLGSGYPLAVAMRFLITYILVAILSYGLESSRHRFYARLSAEKSALEDALAQVKTLRGLLPICTACKKVRDDRGYWQEIEEYVGHRSDADFSHGVCPDCAAAIYPELVAKLRQRETEA